MLTLANTVIAAVVLINEDVRFTHSLSTQLDSRQDWYVDLVWLLGIFVLVKTPQCVCVLEVGPGPNGRKEIDTHVNLLQCRFSEICNLSVLYVECNLIKQRTLSMWL
jgi:hypothetical protein